MKLCFQCVCGCGAKVGPITITPESIAKSKTPLTAAQMFASLMLTAYAELNAKIPNRGHLLVDERTFLELGEALAASKTVIVAAQPDEVPKFNGTPRRVDGLGRPLTLLETAKQIKQDMLGEHK